VPVLRLCVVAVVIWLAGATLALAQGSMVVLRTGGGIPLLSTNASLTVPFPAPDPRLQFDFGFSTDEVFAPGQFFDSFTVTLQDTGAVQTAILLVADASGLVIAPPTPGTILIDPSSIMNAPIPFPSLQPVLASKMAFTVIASIPPQLAQLQQLNVYFDLADNLDAVASLGWFDNVSIIVPEPAAAFLIVLGSFILIVIRRCNSGKFH
jgi:hypothetical protein